MASPHLSASTVLEPIFLPHLIEPSFPMWLPGSATEKRRARCTPRRRQAAVLQGSPAASRHGVADANATLITYAAELIFEMWFLEAKFYENMDNRVQPRTVLTLRLEMMLISCVLIQSR